MASKNKSEGNMILVYVKEADGETVVWELPIRSAKSKEHLVKRIKKMLDEEYNGEHYELQNNALVSIKGES